MVWLEIISFRIWITKEIWRRSNRHLEILEKMGFTSLEHYQEEFDDNYICHFLQHGLEV